jgi:hyperosmotically inducible periplasmic protein
MIKIACKILLATTLSLCYGLWAQDAGRQSGSTTPDNTKTNQRDRSASPPTADQQKENTADRELARQIRRALVEDKSLSTYARNVKVIAREGIVTLRGPVRTENEKTAIENKAAEIAGGPDRIHGELEVAGGTSAKPLAESVKKFIKEQ